MPFDQPTYEQIIERCRADIRSDLPELEPAAPDSVIRAIVDSMSGRHYDNRLQLEQMVKELIPSELTSLAWLIRWARYEGIAPFDAQKSAGELKINGSAGGIIPAGTVFSSENGNQYIALSEASMVTRQIDISLIEFRNPTTSRITFVGVHSLATGQEFTISGADDPDFNGTFRAIYVDESTIDFTRNYGFLSPTVWDPLTITDAAVLVESTDEGQGKNLLSGSALSLSTPITNVASTGNASPAGILGGQDDETQPELLARVRFSRANPVANFNPAAIEKKVREVQGVTRVFVKRIYPNVGDVTVLFTRDFDVSILPDVSRIAEVEAKVLPLTPAKSDDSDVYVQAPLAVPVNVTVTGLTPGTSTLKEAVTEELRAFFIDPVFFEDDIEPAAIEAVIASTISQETGESVSSFTLTAPASTVLVPDISLAVLGEVLFA